MTEVERAIMRVAGELLHETLDEKSFQYPLTLAVVSSNGNGVLVRYVAGDQTLEARVVAQLGESGPFTLPINFMMSDCKGNAAYRRHPEGDLTTIEH